MSSSVAKETRRSRRRPSAQPLLAVALSAIMVAAFAGCGTMASQPARPPQFPLESSVIEQTAESDADLIERAIEQHSAAFPLPVAGPAANGGAEAVAEHENLIDAWMAGS